MSAAGKWSAGMELVYDYKDNKAYRDSFNSLVDLTFGFQFEEWYQQGYWDDRYICYSIADSQKIIANISISKLDLIINGVTLRGIQIGTVMTHPDYRGKGLSRFLMNHVLELYEPECDVFFLFANSSVLDFYPKFAFVPLQESQFSMDVTTHPKESHSFRKLDITNKADLALITGLVRTRKSAAPEFGIENNLSIFMFHVLNFFGDCIYYSEQENAIILYEQKGESLILYDVVSQDYNGLQSLLAKIVDEPTKTVHFYFTPSLLTNEAKSKPLDSSEDQLFIKTSHEWVKSAFRAPKTSHA